MVSRAHGKPEILIVCDKLLTGFDAERNTVLYLCRTLKEHTLLQAIARVNRLFEENGQKKDFGYIVDYANVRDNLDTALVMYKALEGFDPEDLEGLLTDVWNKWTSCRNCVLICGMFSRVSRTRLTPNKWSATWLMKNAVTISTRRCEISGSA
jgi:Type I site-specific restriction-modification system, R (restriction) subunit and related helicases